MDLNTIREKLISGKYNYASEFNDDIQLIIANCRLYNDEMDNPVRK